MNFYRSLIIHRTGNRGFSLAEIIVYLGILTFMTTAGIYSLVSLNETLERNAIERTMTHSASVSLERLVRDIRSAEAIDLVHSVFDSPMGVLVLRKGATTTEFKIMGDDFVTLMNGTVINPLNGNGVMVTELIFTRYTIADTELIRAGLTFQTTSKYSSTTRTFYTSAVLRGSYE